MKYILIIAFGLLLFNCNEKQTKEMNADAIINKAINVAGVHKLNTSIISFDFRDKHYIAGRYQGKFELQRQFEDSIGTIHDFVNNKGFERYINDAIVTVPDSMATKYSASVNSVHYFAVLPHGLDGKAVNKIYLKEVKIKDKNYHKIKVTFNEDGGGEDFEDVFIYWVNKDTFKIDYLAYSYNEDDGIGLRFREVFNERFVEGIRFADYNNYKPSENSIKLEELDQLFDQGKLELLSKIELKNIKVNQ